MNFCNNPKFSLGKTLLTPGALDVLQKGNISPATLLKRHQSGDWGDLCKEDREMNDSAIQNEEENRQRVMSVYKVGTETIWIITEWDRSVTTLLLPSEY